MITAPPGGCLTGISGNTAEQGAGIFARTANLSVSTVSGNSADTEGGGINAATANLTNSTVSGNTAGHAGGGVFACRGTLLNATIVENHAAVLGGGVFQVPGPGDAIHVKNTIVALNLDNLSANSGPDVLGVFVSEGHNLVGDLGSAENPNGGQAFGAAGDQYGIVGARLGPKLGPLQNNGGPTQTRALPPASPAIDRGDNGGAPATDQRGVPRPRDGDGDGSLIVDIGAFER